MKSSQIYKIAKKEEEEEKERDAKKTKKRTCRQKVWLSYV